MIIPSLFRHLYHFPVFLPHLLEREINRFYFVFLMRNFAIGMIAIFEPIYYFLYFGRNISKVLIFYSVLFCGMALFCYWAVKIAGKIGLKRSIILSLPFALSYYMLLWNIEKNAFFLPLAVIFWWIAVLLFWMPINVYFGVASNKTGLGFEVGKFHVLMGLSFALGPLAGGFVVFNFGWSVLFISVISALFITAIALFFSPEIREPYNISVKDLIKELSQKNFLPKAIAFGANGGEHVIKSMIWPIFLFILGINYGSIGIIAAGALVVGTIFTLYIGVLTDRLPKTRLLSIGSILLAFSWILKIFVRTPLNAFLVNVFYGITSATAMVPFTAIFYNEFDTFRSRIIVSREIALNVGRVLMLLFFALIFLYTDKLFLAFPIAALAALLFNLLCIERR